MFFFSDCRWAAFLVCSTRCLWPSPSPTPTASLCRTSGWPWRDLDSWRAGHIPTGTHLCQHVGRGRGEPRVYVFVCAFQRRWTSGFHLLEGVVRPSAGWNPRSGGGDVQQEPPSGSFLCSWIILVIWDSLHIIGLIPHMLWTLRAASFAIFYMININTPIVKTLNTFSSVLASRLIWLSPGFVL